jgi:hypothetical protein
MAGCERLTFHGVSRSAWSAIKRAASSYGVGGSDSGSASVQGYAFSWSYNEATKTLHIQCQESPAIIPCSEINARLQAEVQKVIIAANEEGGETIIV